MSTKEQSATLLRLNKQEQVKALQAVGFCRHYGKLACQRIPEPDKVGYRIAGHAGGM